MKRHIFLSLILCGCAWMAQAQSNGSDYKNAIGLKFYPGAITFKHFMNDKAALEFLGVFWERGYRFTGLYEYHGEFSSAPGLRWYIGGGAHLGAWRSTWKRYYSTSHTVGVDGVLGLDYKITGAPIDLALDWQPSIDFNGYDNWYGWGGLSIRFAF